MKRMKCVPLLLLAGVVLFVACTFHLRGVVADGEEVDIIVNKANTVQELSLVEVKKVFLGDKSTWPNGRRITVLMLAQGLPSRAVILREIYKMPEDQLGQYFVQAAFAGKISAPPREIASPMQMKEEVADNLGAIGYVKKTDVDNTVKVILRLQ